MQDADERCFGKAGEEGAAGPIMTKRNCPGCAVSRGVDAAIGK